MDIPLCDVVIPLKVMIEVCLPDGYMVTDGPIYIVKRFGHQVARVSMKGGSIHFEILGDDLSLEFKDRLVKKYPPRSEAVWVVADDE